MTTQGSFNIPRKNPFVIKERLSDEFGFEAILLDVDASRITPTGSEFMESRLYMNYEDIKEEDATLRFIPYSLWANRGEGEMSVYFDLMV